MAIKETQKCIALADLMEANNCVDLDNRAGIVEELLYGFADEVAVYPDLPVPTAEAPLSFETAGTWDGDLSMKPGCRMYRFNFTDQQGELKISDAGEAGGESVLYELDLTRAKMSQAVFGFENAIRGRKLVLVVRDKNGNTYLLGDKICPARKVAGDGATTGKATTELNKNALKFQYYCPRKLMYIGDTDALLKEVPAAPAT